MTPQERELLTGLFDRLKQCDRNTKEPDAERFIAQAVAAQPSAPYFMAQLLLVQDQALSAAQARISQLEQRVEARAQSAAPARSFLGDAPTSGPWSAHRAAVAPQVAPAPATPTTGYTPPPAPTSSGFLRGALQTAAGVAGGALLFEGIGSLLRHGGGWGGGFLPTGGAPTLVEETVINDYGDALQQPFETGSDSDPGPSTQAADGDAGSLTPAADDVAGDDADWTDDQDGDLV
jgi:hypothetical protein